MPNKLAIFEKVTDNYIAAYFGDDDMFVFEEFDKDLNHKVISSLKINSEEYLNNYYFFGDKVLLIFDGRNLLRYPFITFDPFLFCFPTFFLVFPAIHFVHVVKKYREKDFFLFFCVHQKI